MQVHESLIELVGNTPLLRLRAVTQALGQGGQRPGRAGQGGVLQSRRVGEGPDRAAHGGGGGGLRRAPARRHHHRADLRQHRDRAGHRGGGEGVPLRVRLPGQGGPGQDQCAARLRGGGGRLPRHGLTGPPGFLLLGVDPAGAGDPGRLEAGSVRQPGEPRLALPLHRAGDLGADGRQDHPLRGRDRHRRDDHRRRPVPEGGLRGQREGDRRRPGGLGVLGRHRPALPGGGRRGGHLAGHLRPGVCATR